MKPGSIPGPVKLTPTDSDSLDDYRSAKRLQDHLNRPVAKPCFFSCGGSVVLPAVEAEFLIPVCAACRQKAIEAAEKIWDH